LSLNVLNPGEIAATGVLRGGVRGERRYKLRSAFGVNTFAHVNYTPEEPRLGVLLCNNGVGILNSWIKRNVAPAGMDYEALNDLAATVPVGSEGLSILPLVTEQNV
jgi:xylulokinase